MIILLVRPETIVFGRSYVLLEYILVPPEATACGPDLSFTARVFLNFLFQS